jgi:hypothetical protein
MLAMPVVRLRSGFLRMPHAADKDASRNTADKKTARLRKG